jgi:hypothetical protein
MEALAVGSQESFNRDLGVKMSQTKNHDKNMCMQYG